MLFYQLTYTRQFRAQLNALPEKSRNLVQEKVRILEFDPRPDGSLKKKLSSHDNMYRLRAGHYRVYYSMVDDSVDVLGVDARKDIYRKTDQIRRVQPTPVIDAPSIHHLRQFDADEDDEPLSFDDTGNTPGFLAIDWYVSKEPTEVSSTTLLPRQIDASLIEALRIPGSLADSLIGCRTVEDLINATVSEDVRSRVFQAITEPDLSALLAEPKYVLTSVDELLYDDEFDQIDMLLRLDPDQTRYVNWAISGSGPALLKGGPGTGKSIVGIHRAVNLIERLRQAGISQPRILYTTFTRSLAESSRQLMARLAGNDASLIDVRHLDSIHVEILEANNKRSNIIDDGQRRAYLKRSLDRMGKDRDGAVRKEILSRLSLDYLSDEIDKVIVGRGIRLESEYLTEPRGGRRVRLTIDQRSAIWRLHEIRSELLRNAKRRTWEQSRSVALSLVQSGKGPELYDALVVDEAQDLDPNALRLLIALCRSTDRVFVTADPNQSIYGSGFQWSAVHADLQFRGRTSILRRNYRSTREIGVGATSYLKGSELDEDESAALEYVHSGPQPVVRFLDADADRIAAIMDFVEETRRRNRIGYGGIALLVPSNDLGRNLERQMQELGYPAEFVRGDRIDLQSPRIKIMTLHAAKGLEFPVVVITGLEQRIKWARELDSADAGERAEIEQLNRRLLFVAMTRAMRELLLVLPAQVEDPLLKGIGGSGWTVEHWPNSRT